MIFLIAFVGLWLGLLFTRSLIIFGLIIVLLGIFIFIRFKKQLSVLFLACAFIGIGISFININSNKSTYSGVVSKSSENYYVLSTGLEKFYVKNVDNSFEVGDFLTLDGEVYDYNFATLESSFDFNQYLKDKGIMHGFNAFKTRLIFKNPIKINNYKRNFLEKFSIDSKDFIGSLCFGNGFENELSDTMRSLHLYRLSTLSGLSIFIILSILNYLLSLKFDDEKAHTISLIILLPYIIFSIGKFAIFKLCFLSVFKLVNKKFLNNKFDYISMLSLLGISCLIFDRFLAYQNAFNLSFIMSLFFYFFNNSFHHIKAKKRKAFLLIAVSLFFIPFETQFYHEISLFGPLFQTILSPYIILISIVVTLCFYHIPLYGLASFLVLGLNKIINIIKPIFINIYSPPWGLGLSILYEAVLLYGLYILSIKFKPFYKINCVVLILFSLKLVPFQSFSNIYISFLNIGQGDSTHIHYKDLDILIDTGGSLYKDIAKECLIPYFKKQKIYELDYLITTHDDFDHIGAKDSLIKNFRVKNYLNDYSQFPLKYKDFYMENLNIYSFNSENENDNSLVLKFSLKNTDILVMGDAPKFIETNIINDHPDLRCDILKVGHHGSNTSSSYNFVKTVNPKVAIISCGLNNKYGHPHPDVLLTLNSLHIDIRRTDIESTIIYQF